MYPKAEVSDIASKDSDKVGFQESAPQKVRTRWLRPTCTSELLRMLPSPTVVNHCSLKDMPAWRRTLRLLLVHTGPRRRSLLHYKARVHLESTVERLFFHDYPFPNHHSKTLAPRFADAKARRLHVHQRRDWTSRGHDWPRSRR